MTTIFGSDMVKSIFNRKVYVAQSVRKSIHFGRRFERMLQMDLGWIATQNLK